MPPSSTSHDRSAAREVALRIEGLAKRYRDGEGVVAVDLQVEPGEVVALLGPNGSGKTTTLRCAVGLLVPDRGEVAVYGHPPGTVTAQRATAFVPDGPDLYPALTVEEHLRFRAQAFRLPEVDARVERALEALDLVPLAGRLGGELSRGQRQRAMLAGALVQDARIYVLDEPTTGLDPPALRWLAGWLRDQADRAAGVILATHSLDFVARVADRVVVIVDGRTVAENAVPSAEPLRSHWQDEMAEALGTFASDA